MNWVEQEYLAVAEAQNPDVWLLTAWTYKACDHRFRVRPAPPRIYPPGFFTLPVQSICARCGAEA